MPTEILMPALSPTMEEGKLAKWLIKEGQAVRAGDVIAEIETDKATMEVEAVDEGRVDKLLVAEGTEGVKVNTPIAVLLAEGESAGAAPAPKAQPSQRRLAPTPSAVPAPMAASARRQRRSDRAGRGCRRSSAGRQAASRAQPARRRRTAAAASSPRPWRGGSPRRAGSTSPRSPGPARTGASSRATWRPRCGTAARALLPEREPR